MELVPILSWGEFSFTLGICQPFLSKDSTFYLEPPWGKWEFSIMKYAIYLFAITILSIIHFSQSLAAKLIPFVPSNCIPFKHVPHGKRKLHVKYGLWCQYEGFILFYYSVMHIKTNTLFPALLLFCQSDSLIPQERGTQELPWHRELIKFV